MRERIVVTGAGGFVGRRLIARLAESEDYEVMPVGRRGETRPGMLCVDLRSAEDCRRLISEARPSVVVHLAAQSSVGSSLKDADLVWSTNFDGTRALAEAARSHSEKVRFIFASSAEVYGAAFKLGRCSEDGPIAPQSPYGRSKAACEMVLKDMAGESLPVTVLRLFNHTGPGQDRRFVVPDFVAQVAAIELGKTPNEMRVGNLAAERDFTDVEDIIDAYMAVIARGGTEPYSLYNVGSGTTLSIQEILNALVALATCPIRVVTDPDRLRPSEIPIAAGAMERFKAVYDWRPVRPFAATLASMLKQARGE